MLAGTVRRDHFAHHGSLGRLGAAAKVLYAIVEMGTPPVPKAVRQIHQVQPPVVQLRTELLDAIRLTFDLEMVKGAKTKLMASSKDQIVGLLYELLCFTISGSHPTSSSCSRRKSTETSERKLQAIVEKTATPQKVALEDVEGTKECLQETMQMQGSDGISLWNKMLKNCF